MICPKCEKQIPNSVVICPECGVSLLTVRQRGAAAPKDGAASGAAGAGAAQASATPVPVAEPTADAPKKAKKARSAKASAAADTPKKEKKAKKGKKNKEDPTLTLTDEDEAQLTRIDTDGETAPSGADADELFPPSGVDADELFPPSDVDADELFPPSGADADELFPPSDVDADELFPPSDDDPLALTDDFNFDEDEGVSAPANDLSRYDIYAEDEGYPPPVPEDGMEEERIHVAWMHPLTFFGNRVDAIHNTAIGMLIVSFLPLFLFSPIFIYNCVVYLFLAITTRVPKLDTMTDEERLYFQKTKKKLTASRIMLIIDLLLNIGSPILYILLAMTFITATILPFLAGAWEMLMSFFA